MILTPAGQPKPAAVADIPVIPTIKSLKWEQTKTSNLILGEVNLQCYHDSKKPDMPVLYEFFKYRVPTFVFLAGREVSLDRAAFKNDILGTGYKYHSMSSVE